MESREVTIMEVLDFREQKARTQKKMYADFPEATVVSLGMNIPGPVKSGSSIFRAFCEGRRELRKAILEGAGKVVGEQGLEEKAGYAAIYLVQGIERKKLKEIAVLMEETHPLGRLFDIDVLKENMESISRIEIGAARRKCLLCNQDAKICGRSRAHTVQELQEKTVSIIRDWEEGL
ncbi:MAG: citrate lyase holo-[acyl-carrier protein] synthase [Eubacteriales bacterium]|nr:citrate lyase holo-[acyl-carrier protein] synthase [Eubacteriales bacterium]